MKREIPLFIFDLNRTHNLGECDFVTCTDKESGFIAEISYVENAKDYAGDAIRIVKGTNDVSAMMTIKRIIGEHPNASATRTLMKKAMDVYMKNTQKPINIKEPTNQQCIDFLEVMIRGNRHVVNEQGADFEGRATIITSLAMLEHIKSKLQNYEVKGRDRSAD